MRIIVGLSALALAFTATTVIADPLTERQDLMKERGALMRILAPIAQEQAEFDAAVVLDALEKMNANAQATTDIDALWPEGSEGGESASTIWSDRDGFQAASDKFATDAAAAAEAAPQDLDAFRAVFQPVAGNCGACHEAFRT
jgi:cytochrome c556